MPSILFVHDSYPGQFGGLAGFLHARGWQVFFATAAPDVSEARWPVIRYTPARAPSPSTHPYAQNFERAALNGQACLRALLEARLESPNICLSHAGPGAGLYLRDAFPQAHIVSYCEWWYRVPGQDSAYLDTLAGGTCAMHAETRLLSRARNAPIAVELASADHVLVPTRFQAKQFPAQFASMMTVRHDGIDTSFFAPGPVSALPPGVPRGAPLVTYATRGMEPHRGFPQVVEGVGQLLARHRDVHAVFAGENRVFYGSDAARRIDWRRWAEDRFGALRNRVHFTGTLSRTGYRDLLRQSSAHIYATVPFVLSWSLPEAMAVGVPLVASNTEPVLEFVDEKGATFFDLAKVATLTAAIEDVLDGRAAAANRAVAARRRVQSELSTKRLLPAHAAWLESLVTVWR